MELHITSLREALEEAMEAPTTTPPAVVVDSVRVAEAAALLALLRFQESRGRWKLRNAARLAELVSLDSLLRAIATELLPSLVADPTSHPALGVLSRYARYVKASASAVGGNFFDGVTTICDELIGHVAIASRRPLRLTSEALLRRTNIVLRRLQAFRSRQVLIADADHDYDGEDEDEDDSDADVLPLAPPHLTSSGPPGGDRRPRRRPPRHRRRRPRLPLLRHPRRAHLPGHRVQLGRAQHPPRHRARHPRCLLRGHRPRAPPHPERRPYT